MSELVQHRLTNFHTLTANVLMTLYVTFISSLSLSLIISISTGVIPIHILCVISLVCWSYVGRERTLTTTLLLSANNLYHNLHWHPLVVKFFPCSQFV